MSYLVEVWCGDCRHEDPLGCFDGGSEWITGEGLGSKSEAVEFKTREEAEDAGDEQVRNCGPWRYTIHEKSNAPAETRPASGRSLQPIVGCLECDQCGYVPSADWPNGEGTSCPRHWDPNSGCDGTLVRVTK